MHRACLALIRQIMLVANGREHGVQTSFYRQWEDFGVFNKRSDKSELYHWCNMKDGFEEERPKNELRRLEV